jgi:hypothetical protein
MQRMRTPNRPGARMAGHATKVANAAQMASRPSAVPVAVRYALMVSMRFARAVAAAPLAPHNARDRK